MPRYWYKATGAHRVNGQTVPSEALLFSQHDWNLHELQQLLEQFIAAHAEPGDDERLLGITVIDEPSPHEIQQLRIRMHDLDQQTALMPEARR